MTWIKLENENVYLDEDSALRWREQDNVYEYVCVTFFDSENGLCVHIFSCLARKGEFKNIMKRDGLTVLNSKQINWIQNKIKELENQ